MRGLKTFRFRSTWKKESKVGLQGVAFSLTIAIALLVPKIAPAQSVSPDPDIAYAVKEGIAAAQRQDWVNAVIAFKTADELDPNEPQIWFDLGLALSKWPDDRDHELRAIAFFEAYLDATPNAQNAPEIRAQTNAMEAAYEMKLRTILDQLEVIWLHHKQDTRANDYSTEAFRGEQLDNSRNLASSRFLLGDTKGAINTLSEGDQAWREQTRNVAIDDETSDRAKYKGSTGAPWLPFDDRDFVDLESEDRLATSMIAAGQFDDGLNLIPRIYDPNAVGFALEGHDASRAKLLIAKGGYYSWLASACFAEERHDAPALDDALNRVLAAPDPKDMTELVGILVYFADRVGAFDPGALERLRGAAEAFAPSITDQPQMQQAQEYLAGKQISTRCSDYRWATDMRRHYLLHIARQGVQLDSGNEDTDLPSVVAQSHLNSISYGSASLGLDHLLEMVEQLVETYRKVRGPHH